MDEPVPPAPASRPSPRDAARDARLQREAVALRENLRQRKGQARARRDGAAADTQAPETLPE